MLLKLCAVFFVVYALDLIKTSFIQSKTNLAKAGTFWISLHQLQTHTSKYTCNLQICILKIMNFVRKVLFSIHYVNLTISTMVNCVDRLVLKQTKGITH